MITNYYFLENKTTFSNEIFTRLKFTLLTTSAVYIFSSNPLWSHLDETVGFEIEDVILKYKNKPQKDYYLNGNIKFKISYDITNEPTSFTHTELKSPPISLKYMFEGDDKNILEPTVKFYETIYKKVTDEYTKNQPKTWFDTVLKQNFEVFEAHDEPKIAITKKDLTDYLEDLDERIKQSDIYKQYNISNSCVIYPKLFKPVGQITFSLDVRKVYNFILNKDFFKTWLPLYNSNKNLLLSFTNSAQLALNKHDKNITNYVQKINKNISKEEVEGFITFVIFYIDNLIINKLNDNINKHTVFVTKFQHSLLLRQTISSYASMLGLDKNKECRETIRNILSNVFSYYSELRFYNDSKKTFNKFAEEYFSFLFDEENLSKQSFISSALTGSPITFNTLGRVFSKIACSAAQTGFFEGINKNNYIYLEFRSMRKIEDLGYIYEDFYRKKFQRWKNNEAGFLINSVSNMKEPLRTKNESLSPLYFLSKWLYDFHKSLADKFPSLTK